MIPSVAHAAGEEKIISIKNLRFAYEGRVQALNGVNLDIAKGEYLAIVGGNGSGKTTLAKTMNGLLRPSNGVVLVAGRPTTQCTVAELSRIVGYAFQNPDHQLFCSTVEEEVKFGPQNLNLADDEVMRRVGFALEAMDIGHLSKLAPLSLRLGERRKVSIASVIAMGPEVLVLDEPSTGLDLRETADLMSSIRRLNMEGRTIVLITHDMKLVAEHAKRVVVLSEGRVALDSDPRGVFSDIELLRQNSLEPPPVTLLAHRLVRFGVSKEILSPEELAFELMRIGGGPG